eukprot:6215977-Amphidinium_carterae.1
MNLSGRGNVGKMQNPSEVLTVRGIFWDRHLGKGSADILDPAVSVDPCSQSPWAVSLRPLHADGTQQPDLHKVDT